MTIVWQDLHGMEIAVPEEHKITLPFSEVCMHMGIAGKVMTATLSPSGRSVQLWKDDGTIFSSPITLGEAGWGMVGSDHTVTAFDADGRWSRK